MGERGPIPKRSTQRRRRNKSEEITKAEGSPLTIMAPIAANAKWHATAKRWYNSLATSGQAQFYQASDWALAYVLAENMSRELKPQPVSIGKGEDRETKLIDQPINGASMASLLKGMSMLLVTEGDRRRVALELQEPTLGGEGDADVSELAEYRRRLRAGTE